MISDDHEDGLLEAFGPCGTIVVTRRDGVWHCEDSEVRAICETLARWVSVRNSTCPEFGIPVLDYVAQHLPGRILARGPASCVESRRAVHAAG